MTPARAAGWVGPDTDRPDHRTGSDRARYRRRRAAAVALVAAVLVAGLGAGTWWLLGRFGPQVQDVRVTGVVGIAEGDVRAAAGIRPDTPLAAVDVDGVAARVSGIPGVADVDVSRGWPHTLEIAVVELMPAALVDTPDGPMLVDGTGLAYRTPPDPSPCSSLPAGSAGCHPPGLPTLQLPRVAPNDPATRAALAVLAALDAPVRDQVDTVSLGAGGSTLELGLTGDRRVLWGRWTGPDTAETPRRAAVLGPLLTREGTVYDVSSADLPTVRP